MDSRAHRRIAVEKEIECQINGATCWVRLYDLSSGGCSIEVGYINVDVGDDIRLNLYDVLTINGNIVWKIAENAGVKFEALIGDALVEYLGFSASSQGFDESSPRDRFGRPLVDLLRDSARSGHFVRPSQASPSLEWSETARVQEDRRKSDRGEADRRRELRLDIDAKARLGPAVQGPVEGRLTDLSTHGCSFVDRSGSFRQGDEVWLWMESLEPWKGIVRWVAEDRIGIEFERPFYPAIVEHLVKSSQSAVCSRAA